MKQFVLLVCSFCFLMGKAQKTAADFFADAVRKQYAGENEAAVSNYAEALKLDSLFFPARLNRAKILLKTHLKSEAEKDYIFLFRYDSLLADVQEGLGSIRLEEKHFDSARLHLEKCLRLNPSQTECRKKLAYCSYYTGNYLQAIHLLKDFNPTEINDPAIYYLRALCHKMGGFIKAAEQDLEITIRLQHNHSQAYLEHIEILLQQNRLEEVCKDVDALLSMEYPDAGRLKKKYCSP